MKHFFVIKEWPQQKAKSDTTCSLRTKHEVAGKTKNQKKKPVHFFLSRFVLRVFCVSEH